MSHDYDWPSGTIKKYIPPQPLPPAVEKDADWQYAFECTARVDAGTSARVSVQRLEYDGKQLHVRCLSQATAVGTIYVQDSQGRLFRWSPAHAIAHQLAQCLGMLPGVLLRALAAYIAGQWPPQQQMPRSLRCHVLDRRCGAGACADADRHARPGRSRRRRSACELRPGKPSACVTSQSNSCSLTVRV
jgi:hypothetical protein